MNRRNPSPIQQKAILHGEGPARILAGPGSGKTFTIIQRLFYLIDQKGISPETILTVTFTKAAALEMQNRFLAERQKLSVKAPQNPVFGTIHGICYHILKTSGAVRDCSFIRDMEKRKLMNLVLKNQGIGRQSDSEENKRPEQEIPYELTEDLLNGVSRLKNGMSYEGSLLLPEHLSLSKIAEEYGRLLAEHGLMDFDDMIGKALWLLKEREAVRQRWQRQFQYLLVDEFQDLNPLQYELLKLLAAPEDNFFGVGDDDQSIYGFRGAAPEIMKLFLLDFPSAKTLCLNENYRSGEKIVSLASKIIARNQNRVQKEFHPVCPGGTIAFYEEETRKKEEDRVLSLLKDMHRAKLKSCALIVRTNREARMWQGLLERNGFSLPVPAKNKAAEVGVPYFMTEDFAAFFRFLWEGRRRSDFLVIMNKPMRYLSRQALISETVSKETLYDYYRCNHQMKKEIDRLFAGFAFASRTTPYLAARYFAEVLGYGDYLREKGKKEGTAYEEALTRLVNLCKEMKPGEKTEAFFRRKTEAFESGEQRPADREGVRVLTMHGAKGLEFETVILPDLNEGVIPVRGSDTKESLEEERRLLYVAVTRAQRNLYLLCTRERNRSLTRFLKGLIPPPHQ